MADNLSKAQRSYNMSRIRSRGNSTTELKLISIMREAGVTGWRRKSALCGRPDFVFPECRTAVFVDGCYWHGCKKCSLSVKSNEEYWLAKIAGNAKRDRANSRHLRANGWKVVRIWEHDLKSRPAFCVQRIINALNLAMKQQRETGQS